MDGGSKDSIGGLYLKYSLLVPTRQLPGFTNLATRLSAEALDNPVFGPSTSSSPIGWLAISALAFSRL
eukprot:1148541-Rhodomonas_salina.1